MRRLTAFLTAAVIALSCVFAAAASGTTEAYIENNKITVNTAETKSGKAVFVFFDKDGELCGSTVSAASANGVFCADIIDGFAEIIMWLAGTDDGISSVRLTEAPSPKPTASPKSTALPEPESTILPTASPQAENTPKPETDESEIGTPGMFYTPVPSPEPAENICSVSAECKNALNYESIDEELLSSLPEDGIMFEISDIEITDGMTAYDALAAAAEKTGAALEGSSTYVSGINGLSEFDCGSLSGWMYSVNGEFPNIPMSEYKVSDGDKIEIRYTCDLGADLE